MKTAWKNFSMRWLMMAPLLVALAITGPAWAITLDEARQQGVVGEKPDGLIAAVSSNPSTDVAALISQINSARLASFREVAAEDGAPVQAVQAIAGEKLTQMARQRGWYYMDAGGSWRR